MSVEEAGYIVTFGAEVYHIWDGRSRSLCTNAYPSGGMDGEPDTWVLSGKPMPRLVSKLPTDKRLCLWCELKRDHGSDVLRIGRGA